MSHKILYSELQPCVLVACQCREGEPYLMMFRAMTQVIECGYCNVSYGVVYEGKEMRAVEVASKPQKAAERSN